MSYKVLDRGKQPNHSCDAPGWDDSRIARLGTGAVIQCDCGNKWKLKKSRWWRFSIRWECIDD